MFNFFVPERRKNELGKLLVGGGVPPCFTATFCLNLIRSPQHLWGFGDTMFITLYSIFVFYGSMIFDSKPLDFFFSSMNLFFIIKLPINNIQLSIKLTNIYPIGIQT